MSIESCGTAKSVTFVSRVGSMNDSGPRRRMPRGRVDFSIYRIGYENGVWTLVHTKCLTATRRTFLKVGASRLCQESSQRSSCRRPDLSPLRGLDASLSEVQGLAPLANDCRPCRGATTPTSPAPADSPLPPSAPQKSAVPGRWRRSRSAILRPGLRRRRLARSANRRRQT
jgi:hypothetical protein